MDREKDDLSLPQWLQRVLKRLAAMQAPKVTCPILDMLYKEQRLMQVGCRLRIHLHAQVLLACVLALHFSTNIPTGRQACRVVKSSKSILMSVD